MQAEFLILFLAQAIILAFLILFHGIKPSRSISLFSPVAWFVLFYSLVFWLPQIFMPAFDYTLIGAYNVVRDNQLERVIETQQVLLAFLASFSAAFAALGRRPAPNISFIALDGRDQMAGVMALLIGFAGVAAILIGLDPGNARSIIVASTIGKILYSVSFWFTLGYMIVAAWLIRKRRYVLLVALTAAFAAALLPLGGRGRILWPIAGLVAWASITGHLRIRTWKLIASAVCLGVVLQTLDPLLLYWRGYDSADEAIARFQSGLDLESFLFGRNFDSFHNLAVIVGEDRVAPSLRYLLNGSQGAFMTAYFPSVAWNGVGYPATLPGGLWLSGGLPVVAFGGFAFGAFVAYLSRVYRQLKTELSVVVYCIAMPWLTHVGISYLESYLKMAALILPGIALVRLRRRTSRSARSLPATA